MKRFPIGSLVVRRVNYRLVGGWGNFCRHRGVPTNYPFLVVGHPYDDSIIITDPANPDEESLRLEFYFTLHKQVSLEDLL